MPRGVGRPVQGGSKKLLNQMKKSQKLAREMELSPYESTMHRGYEYEVQNRRMMDMLARSTDAGLKHRETMEKLERKQAEDMRAKMDAEKRRRAEPTSNLSPTKRPRSRMNIKSYKA